MLKENRKQGRLRKTADVFADTIEGAGLPEDKTRLGEH